MANKSRTEELFENNLSMYPHLKYIRDKLWLKDGKSRVSVMVGAGFSLNANIIEDSLDKMSDWPKIKDRLIERLPHHKNIKSQDVLDIGQIYVNEYGRTSLDEILKTSVPDDNYEPSELHYDLLRLPWSDVYTTNYDTLLERTRSNLYERSYEVIYDISDIPGSNQPRIIKLHGSFPAQRPFVFTKSDYENYPNKFSPFVNMVQQSIMETTFLLIGFSGDDPNFENWTNWVSKNLGEHMPKIYMIGIGQKNRSTDLYKKGITLIDFEEIYKCENNKYPSMFKDLFEFLSFENKNQKMDWPYKSYTDLWAEDQKAIAESIELLKFNREKYPNWVIIPDLIRRRYASYIRLFSEKFFSELNFESLKNKENFQEHISLINELIWCYRTFFIPLGSSMQLVLKKLVDSCGIIESIAEVFLLLLKESRLDCELEEFEKYKSILFNLNLTKEQQHEFTYERIQLFLFFGELEKVEEEIGIWNIDSNEIGWNLKKAIILDRMQNRKKSVELFRSSLQTVRRLLTIQPDDYRLLSFESVILNSNLLLDDKRKYDKDRFRYLYSRYCNTDREFNQIALSIKPYEYQLGTSKRKGFDLNTVNISYTYGDPVKQELLDSYALISINEVFNYKCDTNQYNTALENIDFFHPFLSIIKRIDFNNKKSLDDIISREYIYNLEPNKIKQLLKLCENVLNYPQQILIKKHIAIELLSRIYFALPHESKIEIDLLAINQIKQWEGSINNSSYNYLTLKNALEQLIKRIFIDKNGREQTGFLDKIIRLPIKNQDINKLEMDIRFYFDPILIAYDHLKATTKLKVSENFIIHLFKNLEQHESLSLREGALIRIFLLIEKNVLSKKFRRKFKLFIDQQHNKEISKLLLDDYIIRIVSKDDPKKPANEKKVATNFLLKNIPLISFSKIELELYSRELATVFPDYIFSQEQQIPNSKEYEEWLLKFSQWWENQKKFLQNKDTHSQMLSSFLEMIVILKNNILGVIPKQYLTKKIIDCVKSFYSDIYSSHKMYSIYLLPSLIRLGIKDKIELKQITSQLDSKESNKKIISLNCLYDYLVFINKNEILEDPKVLKNIIFNNMRYTSIEVSTACYHLLYNLFKYTPSIFNESDLNMLNQHLSYCLKEIKDGTLIIKTLEDFELISSMAGLASYSFNASSINDAFNYNEWKNYIVNHKLPEVRQYSDIFIHM